jgi:glycosyltransferase involved in cell wall biosynthesis
MRILLDSSYAARGPSGTAVYVEGLAAALRERDGVELVEARQPRRLRRGGGNPLRSAANAALDLLWLHRGLPRAARAAGADVVHHPLPAHSRRIGAAQVATLHDVAFERRPAGYGRVWRALARRSYRRAASRCEVLVSVSRATADDAVELLGAERDRVVVAPHGPGQELPGRPRATAPGHFLYVGDDEERKNVAGLLEQYARYRAGAERPLDLVLAGAAARRAVVAGGVRGEAEPGPERLAELHAEAAALVHPALEEGFGLTLLEAMALGTPVVAVRTRSAEELCGDAALLVGAGGLADALARLGADPALRERLGAAGRERAARHSWANAAQAHESAYTLALQTRSRRAGGPR